MKVMAIGLEPGAARPVLLLQEVSGSRRPLPVWIGIPRPAPSRWNSTMSHYRAR